VAKQVVSAEFDGARADRALPLLAQLLGLKND
jgi:ferric-dicitrate binding protein FerR (iron transport regulator)